MTSLMVGGACGVSQLNTYTPLKSLGQTVGRGVWSYGQTVGRGVWSYDLLDGGWGLWCLTTQYLLHSHTPLRADCRQRGVVLWADCRQRGVVLWADCRQRGVVLWADCRQRGVVLRADCRQRGCGLMGRL